MKASIYDDILLNSSENEKSDKSCGENQNSFMFNNFFWGGGGVLFMR
jgi:hypothetical protein